MIDIYSIFYWWFIFSLVFFTITSKPRSLLTVLYFFFIKLGICAKSTPGYINWQIIFIYSKLWQFMVVSLIGTLSTIFKSWFSISFTISPSILWIKVCSFNNFLVSIHFFIITVHTKPLHFHLFTSRLDLMITDYIYIKRKQKRPNLILRLSSSELGSQDSLKLTSRSYTNDHGHI